MLFAIYAAVLLDLFGFGMIIADVQLRAESLVPAGWSRGPWIGVLLASTFVIQFFVSPKWGVFSDRIGRKPVLITCTLFSAAAMYVYGFSETLAMLFVSRFLAGLGGANVAVAQAFISDQFADEKRTVALSRVGASISLGLISGPVFGGLLVKHYGHTVLGLIAGSASVIAALLVLFTVPGGRPVAASEPRSRAAVDLSLLRDFPALRPFVVIASVAWFSLATLEGTFARLIHVMLNFDQREFGLIFGYESLLSFIAQAFLIGWATTRISDVTLLRTGYLAQGVGLALNPLASSLVTWIPGIVTLLFASTLFALGASFSNPTINSISSKLVPESRSGELFGLMQGTRSIGFVLGPIIGGALFDWKPAAPYIVAGLVCVAAAALVPKSGHANAVPVS